MSVRSMKLSSQRKLGKYVRYLFGNILIWKTTFFLSTTLRMHVRNTRAAVRSTKRSHKVGPFALRNSNLRINASTPIQQFESGLRKT